MSDTHSDLLQQLAALNKRQEKLEEEQEHSRIERNEVRVILSGDMTGKPGAMQYLLQLMEDVYGPKEDRDRGMKSRLEKLEQSDLKRAAWIAGAVCVAGIVVGILWHLADIFSVMHEK